MITDEEQRWFEHQTDREREREMDRAIAAEKERYFRSRGLTVEPDQHGLLVNGRFIVSPTKRRWCLKRRYSWYWYRDEKTLVDEYFLQAGPKKVRVVLPKRSRKAEQAQPRG